MKRKPLYKWAIKWNKECLKSHTEYYSSLSQDGYTPYLDEANHYHTKKDALSDCRDGDFPVKILIDIREVEE